MNDEFEEEEGTGQNRLFVTLAVALIGLLVLGLLGVGAVFIIRQNLNEQTVAVQPSPTLLIKLPNPTATFTPAPKIPTNTPMPTPTNTPVLIPGKAEEAAAAGKKEQQEQQPVLTLKATNTPVPKAGPAATQQQIPQTGFGGLEIALIAVGLAAVLFIARRLRTTIR
jgi:hypothetical protein